MQLFFYYFLSFDKLYRWKLKISDWSGVRFSFQFPVLVLLMVVSKNFLCRQISFDILVHLHIKFSGWSGVRFSVRFPVFVFLMVILEKIANVIQLFVIYILVHPRLVRGPVLATSDGCIKISLL